MQRFINCFLLTAAIVLLTGLTERPRDPWVLRCVLDGNPRMVVIALKPDLWASYDATECTLHKFWKGDVNFSGSVWNHIHGPQPVSEGETLLHGPLENRFFATRQGLDVPCEPVWLGYRIQDDVVTLQYEVRAGGAKFIVNETPEAYVDEQGIRFERRLLMTRGVEGYTFGVRLRAEEGRRAVDLRHNGEPAEDAVGQQFYHVILPEGDEVVIDAIFANKEAAE